MNFNGKIFYSYEENRDDPDKDNESKELVGSCRKGNNLKTTLRVIVYVDDDSVQDNEKLPCPCCGSQRDHAFPSGTWAQDKMDGGIPRDTFTDMADSLQDIPQILRDLQVADKVISDFMDPKWETQPTPTGDKLEKLFHELENGGFRAGEMDGVVALLNQSLSKLEDASFPDQAATNERKLKALRDLLDDLSEKMGSAWSDDFIIKEAQKLVNTTKSAQSQLNPSEDVFLVLKAKVTMKLRTAKTDIFCKGLVNAILQDLSKANKKLESIIDAARAKVCAKVTDDPSHPPADMRLTWNQFVMQRLSDYMVFSQVAGKCDIPGARAAILMDPSRLEAAYTAFVMCHVAGFILSFPLRIVVARNLCSCTMCLKFWTGDRKGLVCGRATACGS